ncbi:hypothetical protein FIBSPDRAFT_195639 [Athelia psychrophila]|uniref:Uncharacterized protein n=1 Tax=Athelia psychrophila TaxID=1759441 RepID=A0A165ZXC7_9AGAM|nr:hypothetical protein FIBSPDRAFT_195639 [Fibularhizoctonia sp. CBS 109695]
MAHARKCIVRCALPTALSLHLLKRQSLHHAHDRDHHRFSSNIYPRPREKDITRRRYRCRLCLITDRAHRKTIQQIPNHVHPPHRRLTHTPIIRHHSTPHAHRPPPCPRFVAARQPPGHQHSHHSYRRIRRIRGRGRRRMGGRRARIRVAAPSRAGAGHGGHRDVRRARPRLRLRVGSSADRGRYHAQRVPRARPEPRLCAGDLGPRGRRAWLDNAARRHCDRVRDAYLCMKDCL